MNNKTFKIIQIIIGILLLAWTVQIIGVERIVEGILSLDPWFVPLLILLQLIILALGSYNIFLLYQPLTKEKISYYTIFKYYCISSTLSLFAPGRLGDFSIIYFLKKEGISVGEGTSLTIFDKIISLTVIISLSLIGAWYFFLPQDIILAAVSLIVLLFFGIIFIFSQKGRAIIKRIIPKKYAILFKGFNKSNRIYLKEHKTLLFVNIFLTILRTLLISFLTFVVFISLGLSLPYIPILLITSLMQLIKMIPITISGIGTTHLFRYYMYATFLFVNSSIIGAMLTILLILRYGVLLSLFFIFSSAIRKEEKRT